MSISSFLEPCKINAATMYKVERLERLMLMGFGTLIEAAKDSETSAPRWEKKSSLKAHLLSYGLAPFCSLCL